MVAWIYEIYLLVFKIKIWTLEDKFLRATMYYPLYIPACLYECIYWQVLQSYTLKLTEDIITASIINHTWKNCEESTSNNFVKLFAHSQL